MEKEFKYEVETLDTFMKLVETREIRISGISGLSVAELKKLSKQLGIYNDKKSGELMKIDLLNLSKIFLAGQVDKYYKKISIQHDHNRGSATTISMKGEGLVDGRICTARIYLRY